MCKKFMKTNTSNGMKKQLLFFASKCLLFLCALIYSPTVFAAKDSVQGYLISILFFINRVVLPLLFGIALLFFLVNVARYFVIGGAEEESQQKAKLLALYGIGAFVFLVSIWGIVNMFTDGLNIDRNNALCPDYNARCREGGWFGSGGIFSGYIEFEFDMTIDGVGGSSGVGNGKVLDNANNDNLNPGFLNDFQKNN